MMEEEKIGYLVVNNTIINLSPRGFLSDISSWTPEVAEALARLDGLVLSAEQMKVVVAGRKKFLEKNAELRMSDIYEIIEDQLGPEAAMRTNVFRLFRIGPLTQVCRYGGLPRPRDTSIDVVLKNETTGELPEAEPESETAKEQKNSQD